MQAWQQVLWDVVVPERLDPPLAVALGLPFLFHRPVDEVDDLDEEGAGAGGRVEDLNEGLAGEVPSGIFRSSWRFAISPQVVVSARPSLRPNSVRSSSSTERTM